MNDKESAKQQTDFEKELCFQCMSPNHPGTHFCRNCGAPLTSYAATGPFESLFAEGHVYRRAAEQPQSLIVVLGIWLIFSVPALTGGFMLFAGWSEGERIGTLIGLTMLLFSILIIGKTTKNYLKRSTN